MRIINRKEFLKIESCVFCTYSPCVFGDIMIKHWNVNDNDWVESMLFAEFDVKDTGDYHEKCTSMENGSKIPMSTEETARNGMFDEDQLFCIFDNNDISEAVEKLEGFLVCPSN